MISMRWAAASTLGFVLVVGCKSTPKETEAPAPVVASEDKIASAKAKYAAMPGVVVGEVEAANDSLAAVSGIDPKAIGKDDVLSFIDVGANTVISHGTLEEASPNGRVVVRFDSSGNGERAPRKGDLCVKLK
jgi:hypothetical protein